ncbi:MAG: cyclopropane fatty acyl phospholipid synthase [Devosia sp.]|nr:cyclopropane fatty acyl phospholipid synthase [Devosia sp.]
MTAGSKSFFEKVLADADIVIGGSRPFDLTVHDERLYDRVLAFGHLGFGEAYMDGWWDCPAPDQFIARMLRSGVVDRLPIDLGTLVSLARSRLINPQRLRVNEVAHKHYDIGNDLYAHMLDRRMIYSCGYWKDATTLDAAQEAKLDLICRKAGLEPGMKVLDIGSGWGGFLKFAAERYGIEGLGITISKEQVALATAQAGDLPVRYELIDYKALTGKFDRIISIGMFEHVGYKNYRAYFQKVRELLVDDGLFVLHTIGSNVTRTAGDPWSEKYIFPNGMLPSVTQIGKAHEKLFTLEDWHNFGAYYDPTLMAWLANFKRSWPELQGEKYDSRFYRMWTYYLQLFAGLFRSRDLQLWQMVFSPKGVTGGYRRVS